MISRWLLKFTFRSAVVLVGLWTALAFFFCISLGIWPAAIAAGGIFGLAISVAWRPDRIRGAAFAFLTIAIGVWYFGFIHPDPNQEWSPEQALVPHVEIHGSKVRVDNLRSFKWHTATDFTPEFKSRTFDLDKIQSMYYIVVPLRGVDLVAHVFVSFGFSDGQHVAVSVEGRRIVGRPYRVIASMFRQYQLIYIIGDEQDVIGKRGAVWKDAVRFYPARTTPDRIRALFVDMMERAHSLEANPEFYHLLFNNCMNNVTHHLRRLGGRTLPSEWRLLLTGQSDRIAYDYGFIDTELPFEKAREAFRIDAWTKEVERDENFSRRLRDQLRRQGADRVPQ